eukprot:15833-Heterococcus_DN1.PRE.1
MASTETNCCELALRLLTLTAPRRTQRNSQSRQQLRKHCNHMNRHAVMKQFMHQTRASTSTGCKYLLAVTAEIPYNLARTTTTTATTTTTIQARYYDNITRFECLPSSNLL